MKTTFSRTFFPAAILLLASLLLVCLSFQVLAKNYMDNRALEQLRNSADAVTKVAEAYHSEEDIQTADFYIHLSVASQVSGADLVLCDADGVLQLCSDSPLGCSHQGMRIGATYLERVFSSGGTADKGYVKGLYEEVRYVVSVPILDGQGQPIGLVIATAPQTQTQELLQAMTNIFLAISSLVILVSVLLMSVFARKLSQPLREMSKAATAFGHGDLNARVRVEEGPVEVQELAVAFNNMASSLQKSEYQRQEFVANVSHELKTPMTTISGFMDGILDGTIPEDRQRYYMQLVSNETKRLSRLVRSMLDISRLQDQGGVPEEKKTRFDLTECAGQVLITFEQKITAKKLDVQVDMPELPVYTQANQDYITQVIYNLLDNAVKFCPEEGNISLRIRSGGTKAYVSIANSGQTIPPEELPLVFDRFHKLDKSRAENRDGWGLGLYIVKTIVCSHGEDISVSSAGGKTEFTFTMPLVN